jgi:hypothetical protein
MRTSNSVHRLKTLANCNFPSLQLNMNIAAFPFVAPRNLVGKY